MSASETNGPSGDQPQGVARAATNWRWMPAAHTLALAAVTLVFTVWLLYLESRQWFVTDEWDYLHGSCIQPHNEHTVVFTKAWFQLLLAVVGLHGYVLYALPLVAGHLATAWIGYRLLRIVGVNGWTAASSSTVTLAMGAGAGTLTWAGQMQHTGSVAAGLAVLLLAVQSPHRRLLPVGLTIALFGTFNGSAYLMWGITAGALFAWQRRWSLAAAVAAPPLVWTAVLRTVWHPDTTYAVTSLSQLFSDAPSFVRAILDTAITQTFQVQGITIPLMLMVWLGASLVTRRVSLRKAPQGRELLAVGLAMGVILLLSSLALARLGRGSELAANGGYSYLVLAALIPLCALLWDSAVGPASFPTAVFCAGAVLVTGVGCETLRKVAVSTSEWKLGGKRQVETAAFLFARNFATYPEVVAAPGTAPTVASSTLLDYSRRGILDARDWGEGVRDQLSLNLQWRARAAARIDGECAQMVAGTSFTATREASATVSAVSASSVLQLTYEGSTASREFAVTDAPAFLETLSERSGTFTVASGAVSVCR